MTYNSIVDRTGFDFIAFLYGDYTPTSEMYIDYQLAKLNPDEYEFLKNLSREEFYRIAREKGYAK